MNIDYINPNDFFNDEVISQINSQGKEFKAGQVWIHDSTRTKYIICIIDENAYNLISLADGNRWTNLKKNYQELKEILKGFTFFSDKVY